MRRLLFAAGVLALGCCAAIAADSHPNILLILTDDQGYGDFSIHGNPYLKTPNIDKLAREGVQFERFFVSPLCAPTRSSLLTGRWWPRCGVWGVTHSKEMMRLEEVTIAEALKGAGYATGIFGKWHNGEQFPYTPQGQGFDEFLGFHNGHWNNYFDTELLHGAEFVKTKGYITDVLADAAIQFIEKNKSQPFFCYVPFNAPHAPFQVPDKYFDRFKGRPGLEDMNACVYAMCECLDDNVGRLLAALDRLKLRENTIVLFATDNGANTDRYNAGMKGRKGSVHEGGSRVPLFIQWPAKLKEPRLVKQIAAHIDLYPTLLELCGIKPPPGPKLDGVSLVPLLEGRTGNWPERALFSYNVRGETPQTFPGAVRTQQYRLVNDSAVKPGKAAKNKAGGDGWQLYDMIADPGQAKDIAAERPEVVKQLSATYEAWWKDVSSRGFTRFPLPVGYDEEDPVELHTPQAYFEGGLQFFCGPGFANDWLTSWKSLEGKIWFDIDVVKAGNYEVTLRYLCPQADGGSKIRVSIGAANLEATVPGAPVTGIPLPHRAEKEGKTYTNMEWAMLKAGRVQLPKGPARLTVKALSMPRTQVMDLKGVILQRVK